MKEPPTFKKPPAGKEPPPNTAPPFKKPPACAKDAADVPIKAPPGDIAAVKLIESKAHGADVILLIAASLPRKDILRLSTSAKNLGLEVLLEVHNEEELERGLMPTIDLLGVNNRNLKTFEVSIQISLELASKIPDNFVKVSESGISSVAAIQELKKVGYSGFLIGENFMKTSDPMISAYNFIKKVENEI